MKRRRTLYVYSTMGAFPCSHCSSGKAMSITQTECVFFSLMYPTCFAHAPFYHLWPAPSTKFFNFVS